MRKTNQANGTKPIDQNLLRQSQRKLSKEIIKHLCKSWKSYYNMIIPSIGSWRSLDFIEIMK